MPDGYTHVLVAKKAAAKANVHVPSSQGFIAGANGPDPLFFHKVWASQGKSPLYALSTKLHNEKIGAFLQELLRRAISPIGQSYAIGFVCHYAIDCVFHPFIYAMTEAKNAPYNMPYGHMFFESSLDSHSHTKETGTSFVPREESTPHLSSSERLWVASQMRNSVQKVYKIEFSQKNYEDAFRHMWFAKGILGSPYGGKRLLVRSVELAVFKKSGFATSHMQPGRVLKPLPTEWENVFTGEKHQTNLAALQQEAIERSAFYLQALNALAHKQATMQEVGVLLGNNSYETGQPIT